MAVEVIVFPDPVTLVTGYLSTALPAYGYSSIHVGARVPNPRPVRFVRVDRVGGPRSSLVTDAPTLVIEAWAGSVPAAHALLATCRGLINALPGTHGDVVVSRVTEFSGPATLPDPDSDQPRATYTVQIQTRGEAI